MPKILITGCKGQLGIELVRELTELSGMQIIETDLHNLDITNQRQVIDLVMDIKPEVIVNCAAFTNVDKCETEEKATFQVNALGAQNLAIASYNTRAKIIQISTDYVFDGNDPKPKREYDPINPLSVYGKSKAWGEKLVRESNPQHFILRTAWLYGEGHNFVRTMLKLGQEKGEVSVVNDQIGSPTFTKDLARCIIDLMQTESYGTYHATCEGSCSWYEFAQKIFDIKGLRVRVNPITTEELSRVAQRPKYSVLENFMLGLVGLNNFRHWGEALEEFMVDH